MKQKFVFSIIVAGIVLLNLGVISTSSQDQASVSSLIKVASAQNEGNNGGKVRVVTYGQSSAGPTQTKTCPSGRTVTCTTTYRSYKVSCPSGGNEDCTPGEGKTADVFCPSC